jgi:hypothetical protein
VRSSEVFTKAALACCGIYDDTLTQVATDGSQGSNLPAC